MENLFRLADHGDFFARCCVWVNGPVIVGVGPSGLATAVCLRDQGVPLCGPRESRVHCLVVAEENLRQAQTSPSQAILPAPLKLAFPEDFPEYPTRRQFVKYLESYARRFEISPNFNKCVQSARYDETSDLWHIRMVQARGPSRSEIKYICRCLVVATRVNAERVVPEIDGLVEFKCEVVHACDYKSGEKFDGKRVLVVGSGNSGMEVSLDLCNHQRAFLKRVVAKKGGKPL